MFEFITQAVIDTLNNPLLVSLVLGALPVSEIRGASIYAFSIGQPWLILPAMFVNILVSPLILLFWNLVNIPRIASFALGRSLEQRLLKFGKSYEKQGLIALILFIGIPLPVTGVYTGTLLAELLGIKREKILVAASAGVVVATILMFMLLGGFSLFLTNQ